jgi:hypothetical protein
MGHQDETRRPPPLLPWLPVSAALVARQRHQQDLAALEEIAVVVLAGSPGRVDHRPRRRRQLTRDARDGPGADAGDGGGLCRGVAGIEVLAEHLEQGAHGDLGAIGQPHRTAAR